MPWKTVSILWPTIVAALLPLDLATLITRLPWILQRLAVLDAKSADHNDSDRSRPRTVDRFRSRFERQLRRKAAA